MGHLQYKCHISELVRLVVHMLGPDTVLSLVLKLKGIPLQVLIILDSSQSRFGVPQPLSHVHKEAGI